MALYRCSSGSGGNNQVTSEYKTVTWAANPSQLVIPTSKKARAIAYTLVGVSGWISYCVDGENSNQANVNGTYSTLTFTFNDNSVVSSGGSGSSSTYTVKVAIFY